MWMYISFFMYVHVCTYVCTFMFNVKSSIISGCCLALSAKSINQSNVQSQIFVQCIQLSCNVHGNVHSQSKDRNFLFCSVFLYKSITAGNYKIKYAL